MVSPTPTGSPSGRDWQKIGAIIGAVSLIVTLIALGISSGEDDKTNNTNDHSNCNAQGDDNQVTC